MKQTPKIYSALICLIGIVLLLMGLQLDRPEPENFIISKLFSEFLKTIGPTLFVAGVLSILMDFHDWREYFASRLSEIVMEDSYLKKQSEKNLRRISNNTYKSLYTGVDLDSKGSFYNYLSEKIEGFISEPYRSRVSSDLIITDAGENRLHVIDTTSYTCVAVNGKIQEFINWSTEEDEFDELLSLEVSACTPNSKKKIIDKKFTREQLTNNFSLSEKLDAKELADGLKVFIKAEYVIHANRFQYWQMACLTHGFDITINYPTTHKLQHQSIFFGQEDTDQVNVPGHFKAKHDDWVFPDNGVAWDLRPITKNA